MTYRFQDVVDVPALQELTDKLYDATSIPSAVITMEGDVLTGSGWQRICTDFHRQNPDTLKECVESDICIRTRTESGEEYVLYKCPRGLVDGSSPVIIDGKHVANVFAGQVFMEPPDETVVNDFREQARRFGFDENSYMEAFYEVPVFSEERFRSALEFLSKFAKLVANIGLAKLKERKVSEKLSYSERRYRRLLESTKAVPWELDLATGRFTYVGPQIERLLGYRAESWENIDVWAERIHPDDREESVAFCEAASQRGEDHEFEYRCITQDGDIRWIQCVVSVLSGVDRPEKLVGFLHDITERKETELALLGSRQNYENLFASMRDTIVVADLDRKIVNVNQPALQDLFGYQLDEIRGKDTKILYAEETAFSQAGREIFDRHGKAIGRHMEIDCRKKNGEVFPSELFALKLIDEHGEMAGNFSVIRDISERKKAEAAIAKAESEWTYAMDFFEDAVYLVDLDDKVIRANKAFYDLTGLTPEKTIGHDVTSIIHPDGEPIPCPVCIARRERRDVTIRMEADHPGNSTGRPIEVIVRIIRTEKGATAGILMGIHDLTRSRKVEEEVQKAQKLEALGILAGGIAHDFNNLLTTIFGNVSLARMQLEQGSSVYQKLERIEEALEKTTNLTHQLLTFSKGGTPIRKPQSIVPLIEESVRFALSGSDIEERIIIADDLWNVDVDQGQINQVIQNLVMNARDAMPEGGEFEVRAENRRVNAGDVPQLAEGAYVVISVSDAGVGIPRELISKVFDPYFTTKEHGSGLGLAASYSIVRNHGGTLTVASEEAVGTTFTIYLPATASDVSGPPSKPGVVRTGGGRVLLVIFQNHSPV